MNKIRYLTFLLLALVCGAQTAAQGYDPANPADPGMPPQTLTLLIEPAGAGSVSGGGKIVPEAIATLKASANSNWTFVSWTDEKGTVLATTSQYKHVKLDRPETLTAHFEFTPGAPAEPDPGSDLVYYRLDVIANEGGTVSGGGRYQKGKSVTLRATCNTNFEFLGWVNADGETVSTKQSFSYTKQEGNETLTACFVFNPGDPTEPSNPILSHRVTVVADEGGTASGSTITLAGSKARLIATANPGYKFIGWYLEGKLYTTLAKFDYTMGEANITFEARFEFNPSNPSEPSDGSDNQKHSIYLLSPVTYPGRNVDLVMYLSNTEMLCDMHFNLTFPEGLKPNLDNLSMAEGFEGYDITVAPSGEACGYTITMIGGQAQDGNREMLRIPLIVPEDLALGTDYQLKINQVSVTQEDGTTTTASTRNGRVSVYRRGDTNGDGSITITDVTLAVEYMLDGNPKGGIREVADVNNNGEITITDVTTVVSLMLEEE